MPKCGGTSLTRAIRDPRFHWDTKRFDSTKATIEAQRKGADMLNYREEKLRELLDKERYNYVMGHFRCTQATITHFKKDWDFITLLRNPVDRWLSHYFYNRYKKKKHFQTDMSLDEYIESDQGQVAGSIYVRNLTATQPYNGQLAIAEAKETLSMFSVIGTLEDQERFNANYKSLYGKSLKLKNHNPNPTDLSFREDQVSSEALAKIEELCSPDRALYDEAIALSMNS